MGASPSSAAFSASLSPSTDTRDLVIVQYVVLRKDIITALKWPLGAVVSQACHASTAVIAAHADDADVQRYLRDADAMHKVTLEVPDEPALRELSATLETAGIAHKLWVEMPESVATALATKPYERAKVAQFSRNLRLLG